MTAVTIWSDFGARENKICHCFHFSPIYMPWNDGTGCHDLCFLNIALSQLFHSPLSLSSRGSLVPLCFLPLEWYHLHMLACWYFSWQSWFQLVLHPAQHFTWCTLYISYTSMVTGLQPWCSPFPILKQSIIVPCPVLTSASLTTLKPLTVWITTNWKILKEMGIPDYLICLLRNLYAG